MKIRIAWLAALLLAAAPAAAAEPDGAALYKTKCASCHGADGKGETSIGKALKLKSLLDPRWAGADAPAAIAKLVREGAKGMPPLASKLTAAEIEAVSLATRDLAAAAAKP